jgi:hypothetical protein
LLTSDLAADTHEQLETLQRHRNLGFGKNVLCTSLRPRFLTPAQYRLLIERVPILMRAMLKIHEAALADAGFRAKFRPTPEEEILLRIDHRFTSPMPTGRLDAFVVPGRDFLFTEFNAETPAAPCYTDGLAELFLSLPITGEFLKYYRLIPLPARHGVLHGLMESFRQWAQRRERPRIGILDWREVPTYSEFLLFQDYFRAQGLECIIADPREVEYRNGKLMAGDFHITLIYKRVLISELIEIGGMEHPIIRAVRDGAVCMTNPFRCKLLYKKASLAVLSDEQNTHLFSQEEKAVVARHIPWTRIVEERKTLWQGQSIDLVPWVLANKEQLVLKPNDDYGGKGIVLGWLVDQPRWEEAVRTALATPYVAQERIDLPEEPYPSLVDGQVRWTPRKYDTAPFVVLGSYVEGCLTRISTDPLLNVTAGGGSTVPTFVIEER